MKICDLIAELQRHDQQSDVGVEVAPEDLFGSSLHGTEPEPDIFDVHCVERNGGGDRRVCKIILTPN